MGTPHSPSFFDASSSRHFSLGRYALTAGLKLFALSKGDLVLVPEFICRDLLASLHAAQVEAIFYPVDRNLVPRSLPVAPKIKAILAVNYFGFPQALEPFRSYCAAHGTTLIEDNAHGFLSCDQQGQLLGTRGDIGIMSFRKTFALPDGAALVLNRKEWAERLPAVLAYRETPLSFGFVIKRTLRHVQNTTGLRVRTYSEQLVRHLRRQRTGSDLPLPLPEAEREIPGNPAMHGEALRSLEKVDAVSEVKRRRELYQWFEQNLRHLSIEPVFADLSRGIAPYGYPFRAKPSVAAHVVRIAQRQGFDCFRWPDLPTQLGPPVPDFYQNIWWVNFLC